MTLSMLFWLLMLLALLFGGSKRLSERAPPWSSNLLLWIMLLVLGWAVFGAPIK